MPDVRPPDVRYRIRATLDDTAGVVSGSAEIRYLHLGSDTLTYLRFALPYNAYRPGGSGWPHRLAAGAEAGGSMRVSGVRAAGRAAGLVWTAAADSSLADLPLPNPLLKHDSVVVSFDWTGRPPSAGPRIDRRGRRINLHGWYPQLLDMTSPTSVKAPAFASFLLRLDLARDQVVGGTGVPLCGDPGWEGARAFLDAYPRGPIKLQRDYYIRALDAAGDHTEPRRLPRDPLAGGASCDGAPPGAKRLVWYAEGVAEVALVMGPSLRYEEGDFNEKPVRALYEASEERVWGAGLGTRRAEAALAWVKELGGDNPWPHLTVAPGLGPSGYALPMVLLPETSTQAALLELLGLMFTQQVMTGGESKFTVGAAAYMTGWFFETLGRRGDYQRLEREILDWDLDRLALDEEPITRPSLTSPCATTSCRRAEFMIHQLRHWSRSTEAVRQIYGAMLQSFPLRPTIRGGFQLAARRTIHPSPDSLYTQFGVLHDDAIRSAERVETEDGQWRTTVAIERKAPGFFPRTVQVIARGDTVRFPGTALTARETLTVVTRTRPERVVLDPDATSHDWNMLNNEKRFGLSPGWLLLTPQRPRETYLDTYFTRRTARNRATLGWAPTVWYNDAGGWTLGLRLREDYLGRFELNELWASVGTGWTVKGDTRAPNARLRIRNPVGLRAAGWSQELALAYEEGRAEARVEATKRFRSRVLDPTWRSLGLALHWLTVSEPEYPDAAQWDDAGTAELTLTGRLARAGQAWPFELRADVGGGYAYPNGGGGGGAGRGGYGRFTVSATAASAWQSRWGFSARLFGGAVLAADSVPRQRRIYLAGADPYQRFGSPFLRSRGSLLSGRHYHAPGGAGVRGLDARLSSDRAVSAGVELEYAVRRRPLREFLGRIALAAFFDGALGDGALDAGGDHLRGVADAGVGLRISHRLGQTRFVTRLDFPFWVSRPALAADADEAGRLGYRWTVSFQPAW